MRHSYHEATLEQEHEVAPATSHLGLAQAHSAGPLGDGYHQEVRKLAVPRGARLPGFRCQAHVCQGAPNLPIDTSCFPPQHYIVPVNVQLQANLHFGARNMAQWFVLRQSGGRAMFFSPAAQLTKDRGTLTSTLTSRICWPKLWPCITQNVRYQSLFS